MAHSFLAVGLGAALGAWARWGLSLWLNPTHRHLPLGTLAANLIGGYVIGLAVAWFASHPAVSPAWRLFIITGMLGGLTTFSTFSAEVVHLFEQQEFGWALLTVATHLIGSTVLTFLGILTVRSLSGQP